MVILGGWVVLMSEVPLYRNVEGVKESAFIADRNQHGHHTFPFVKSLQDLQGYLAHKKTPPPSEPPRTLGIGLR